MLDKLAVTQTGAVDPRKAHHAIENSFPGVTATLTSSKYYTSIWAFRSKGKPLASIHMEPRLSIAPTRVELNPTRFGSFKELTAFLSLLGDPSSMSITRIDHTVDVEGITVSEIRECLYYSRKRWRCEYADGKQLTGFYLGVYPEVLCIYDKGREQGTDQALSRIELSQFQKKVPVKPYLSLPEYQSYTPFSAIKVQRIKDTFPEQRELGKGAVLSGLVKEFGFQATYKMLNKHSNFRRDFSSLLEEDQSFPKLNEVYQSNLKKFFMEGQNGNREADSCKSS